MTEITRRKLIAGAGVAGMLALAGCMTQEQATRASIVDSAATETPPQPPSGTPDNEYWQYMIDSMEYQNQQALAQTEGVLALLEDAGITSEDED